MPALPDDEAIKYVLGAYLVFLVLLLIYVAIMATRIERMRRDLSELADIAEQRQVPVGADAGARAEAVRGAEGSGSARGESSRQEVF
ncbi:MAG: hypothetical protein M3Y34_09110 [Actinomycetota bacterium]|nr:hypothetical protein [Actinomycetota bacterium]